jgi:hypothetical protein
MPEEPDILVNSSNYLAKSQKSLTNTKLHFSYTTGDFCCTFSIQLVLRGTSQGKKRPVVETTGLSFVLLVIPLGFEPRTTTLKV